MIEIIVGTLAIIDFTILLVALLYWVALDCFKGVPEADDYVILVNRGIDPHPKTVQANIGEIPT